jgi:hypothetical protein
MTPLSLLIECPCRRYLGSSEASGTTKVGKCQFDLSVQEFPLWNDGVDDVLDLLARVICFPIARVRCDHLSVKLESRRQIAGGIVGGIRRRILATGLRMLDVVSHVRCSFAKKDCLP